MKRCLYCYNPLAGEAGEFHTSCSKKIFGLSNPPALPISEADLEALAWEVVRSHTALTGVQAKLSLHITGERGSGTEKRFSIGRARGGWILKPPTVKYPQLPEVEDLTMHLAAAAGIETAPHTLVRMQSGGLAYVTRRMDRAKSGKLAMEDMCQLTERLTEHKYRGSYEQIGKAIGRYSATPGLDVVNVAELVLFCFLTGNADMHLKNFSLLERPGSGMRLSPAYDLVNTALVNPADEEDLALSLNGRRKKLKRRDFVAAMDTLGLDGSQQRNLFAKLERAWPAWREWVGRSFLSEAYKARYLAIIEERFQRIA